jgi:hypothetical protein
VSIDSQDVDEIVRTVELIASVYGGIDLETMSSMRATSCRLRRVDGPGRRSRGPRGGRELTAAPGTYAPDFVPLTDRLKAVDTKMETFFRYTEMDVV